MGSPRKSNFQFDTVILWGSSFFGRLADLKRDIPFYKVDRILPGAEVDFLIRLDMANLAPAGAVGGVNHKANDKG
jgi:hypothetical protein